MRLAQATAAGSAGCMGLQLRPPAAAPPRPLRSAADCCAGRPRAAAPAPAPASQRWHSRCGAPTHEPLPPAPRGSRRTLPPPAAAAAGAAAGGGSPSDGVVGGWRSRRHPDLLRAAQGGGAGGQEPQASQVKSDSRGRVLGGAVAAAPEPAPRPEEVDDRYRRADYSDVYQYESRQAFARAIAGGEPRMRLAAAALHVTAEDDAIASLSTVRFPVEAWLERIDRLVDQLCAVNLRRAATAVAPAAGTGAAAGATAAGGAAEAAAEAVAAEAGSVLRVVERYLWEECGFRAPDYGRSNLPPNAVVDHAGVWEDARLGYLHETLVRRQGHPATLGLLLGDVCARLLDRGRLPCAAAIDTQGFQYLPRAVALPQLTRDVLAAAAAAQAGGGGGEAGGPVGGLNTCTSEVLVEMLRHLKRAYWPFAWDSGQHLDAFYPGGGAASHGGFRSAAKLATGEEMSAALAAIAKVAAWRLERGIFTSAGAGDIRRARAACERLVLLAADRYPEERRDLAIILLHSGDVPAARRELRAYMAAVGAGGGGSSSGGSQAAAGRPGAGGAAAGAGAGYWSGMGPGPLGPDPFDLVLCRRLLATLEGLAVGAGEEEEQGPGSEPLSVDVALRLPPPWERAGGDRGGRALPLTW
ncbi:hypothetical protein HXX76_004103 [Chlamydomonas incerta]|uniref:Protein SirB1 N-terminal domain-containing protein n=1 Tax=Chlamydomonas incerta TaxID=51695 RepID=A0A835TLM1_CHLIN|nr:hypothetical protein HXX76_004103 [Chlamydomonas incerta]|eukprot:KAG2439985.1 hypothetical protein HXX76_004103 [Chlamydomonas incerta]